QGGGDKPGQGNKPGSGGSSEEGNYDNKSNSISKDQNKGTGKGIGSGRGGFGEKPNELTNPGYRNSRVGQDLTAGKSRIVGEVEGPNRKGEVQQEIVSQVEAAKVEVADPITGQHLPRHQRDHNQQYFKALRTGK